MFHGVIQKITPAQFTVYSQQRG